MPRAFDHDFGFVFRRGNQLAKEAIASASHRIAVREHHQRRLRPPRKRLASFAHFASARLILIDRHEQRELLRARFVSRIGKRRVVGVAVSPMR